MQQVGGGGPVGKAISAFGMSYKTRLDSIRLDKT